MSKKIQIKVSLRLKSNYNFILIKFDRYENWFFRNDSFLSSLLSKTIPG